jgi:hypothetical protein
MKTRLIVAKAIIGFGVLIFVMWAGIGALDYFNFFWRIESTLDFKFESHPTVVDYEDYGWAEEGGRQKLLKLSPEDCVNLEQILKVEVVQGNDLFAKNYINPKKLKGYFSQNQHGDLTSIELDVGTCHLMANFHYE